MVFNLLISQFISHFKCTHVQYSKLQSPSWTCVNMFIQCNCTINAIFCSRWSSNKQINYFKLASQIIVRSSTDSKGLRKFSMHDLSAIIVHGYFWSVVSSHHHQLMHRVWNSPYRRTVSMLENASCVITIPFCTVCLAIRSQPTKRRFYV